MIVDRTPFTTFDLIGYFIPGFMFLYLLYLTFNIDFDSILLLENKSAHSYEYMVFTIFFFLFSWLTGHLLSFISHFFQKRAYSIFLNEEQGSFNNILDIFGYGARKIFTKNHKDYNTLIKKIFSHYTGNGELYKNVKDTLFLKGISSYLDQEKFKIVYNYIVIQGTFRAFTLIFLFHFILMLIAKFGCSLIFEDWIKYHINYILFTDISIAYICWCIYLKYFRRQIEETIILLIYDKSKFPHISSM